MIGLAIIKMMRVIFIGRFTLLATNDSNYEWRNLALKRAPSHLIFQIYGKSYILFYARQAQDVEVVIKLAK